MNLLRVARFLRCHARPGAFAVREEELRLRREDREVEATLYLPPRLSAAPWIVLHGVTVPGRRHQALVPFVRALAATGSAVLVPDVPEWRELRVRSASARQTLVAAARYLEDHPKLGAGKAGVVGFSFGATHALAAVATDDYLRVRADRVVGFGGYSDLRRIVRCMFTGEHEWRGVRHRLSPDPYGRWIVAGNFLANVPGLEEMGRVAEASRKLAVEAGRRGAFAAEAEYDPVKEELARDFGDEERAIWDLLAPPAGAPAADPVAAADLADALAAAAFSVDPGFDPHPALADLRAEVVLAHGGADRLIPFTESLRLREALPAGVAASVTITRLYAHSKGEAPGRVAARAVEVIRFARLLHRAFRDR